MPVASIDGKQLYYEFHGQGHPGTPLLLLTGIGGSCKGWLPLQVPAFSAQRPTLILDYPGVGDSEGGDGAFDSASLAQTALGLLDALSLPRVSVLGSFLGGMVAQELALAHAERLERLILVGTWARADAKRRLLLAQWRELARIRAPLEVLVRDRLLWTAHDTTLEQGDLIDTMVGTLRREGLPLDADCFERQCDACLDHDALDRLRGIRRPTLVVCGREDALTPPFFHRQIADEISEARLVTFPHAAHLLMIESAEAFNRTVLDFLDGQ